MKGCKKWIRHGLFLSVLVGLAGCATTSVPPLQKMTFDQLEPFPLYVASYEIKNQTLDMLGFAPDNVEQGFIASVSQTVDDYLRHRFSAVGTNGKFLAVLKEATLTQKQIPSDNRIGAWMNVDNRDRYDLKVVVHMAVFGLENYEKRGVDVIANQMVTIPEHVTLAERETLQMQALDSLLDNLDGSIQQVLREDFRILRPY